jgi:hypothetical protein
MKYPRELANEIANEWEANLLDWEGIEQNYQLRGLSPMRLRWDMLRAAFKGMIDGSTAYHHRFIRPAYDAGMHDEHIDTALRYAAKQAGYEYAATK